MTFYGVCVNINAFADRNVMHVCVCVCVCVCVEWPLREQRTTSLSSMAVCSVSSFESIPQRAVSFEVEIRGSNEVENYSHSDVTHSLYQNILQIQVNLNI